MLKAAGLLMLLICGAALAGEEQRVTIESTDPRSRPIIYAMIAGLDGDLPLHQFAFSSRIRKKLTDAQWPKHQKAWKDAFERMPGQLSHAEVAQLKFVFWGDDEKGSIAIVLKDGNRTPGGIRLAREDGMWKIDEN